MTAPSDTTADDTAPGPGGPGGDAPHGALQPLAVVRAANLGRTRPVWSSTPLGTVDAGAIGDVDGAGLVQMRGAEWSLDWWVGAEDRWHHPSAEAAVRQRPIGEAPVVETAMRVPGGDVIHRAYGVRASSTTDGATWDDSAVVVEVENSSAVPVALAFSVRPVTLVGPGRVVRLDSEGPVVSVDERVAMVLSREPARIATGRSGEPAAMLVRGEDMDGAATSVTAGPDGVEVAFVVPLPHTSIVRVLLTRVPEPVRRRPWRSADRGPGPGAGWSAPEADSVVSGWAAHTGAAARVELPEPLLSELLSASLPTLALASSDGFLGDAPVAGDASAATRAAWICESLARAGTEEPLGPLGRALVSSQLLRGAVKLADGSDGTVALVHAATPLLETGAPGWIEDLLGPVAKAVHRLGRGGGLEDGALVRCAIDGLLRLAPVLRRIDQPEVAAEAERIAGVLASRSEPSTAMGRGDSNGEVAASIRSRLRAGDRDAAVDLLQLARTGGPGTLVDRVDDAGVPDGHMAFDPAAVANRVNAVLDSVLLEGPVGPVVLPAWPSAWWGQPIEAHAIQTRWGRTSFGLRWHGERPALLWEVERDDRSPASEVPPVFTAPVLDPSWRGEGWTGEALLAPVEVPATFVAIRGPGPGPQPSGQLGVTAPEASPPAEGQSFS